VAELHRAAQPQGASKSMASSKAAPDSLRKITALPRTHVVAAAAAIASCPATHTALGLALRGPEPPRARRRRPVAATLQRTAKRRRVALALWTSCATSHHQASTADPSCSRGSADGRTRAGLRYPMRVTEQRRVSPVTGRRESAPAVASVPPSPATAHSPRQIHGAPR
jgi:hypothetical protein